MKKGTAISIIVILLIITAGAVTLTLSTMRKIDDAERSVAAGYRHTFSEVVAGTEELDAALQKCVYATSPSMAGVVCAEIYAKAQTTSMSLGVLPFPSSDLEKTAAFINSAGDFAFSLAQKAARGEEFTPEERESLKALSKTASELYQNLKSIDERMGSAMVDLEEYRRTLEYLDDSGEELPPTLADTISAAEEEFPEMPHLIYDGPFSEHLKDSSPKFLEGREEIDESEGRKIAAAFIGMRQELVYLIGERSGILPSYCYEAEVGGASVNICVTKKGGEVFSVLNSRQVPAAALTATEALNAAKKILERRGYADMRESYYLIQNNVLTASFASVQDGILCYPDLIHVGIALDNGMLQNFEATGFISSHAPREIPAAEVSLETARERISPELEIISEQTVIIPSPGRHEVLCYEFTCRDIDGRKFIIYVNALTGNQERILILLEDESGAVTM